MPWILTSSLQNSERIYFCCSKPPSQWDFILSALRNESTSFLFSRHTRSFSITGLPHVWFPLPTIFFPTLVFQTWTQSFGSLLKCYFLKDALWAYSTWTYCLRSSSPGTPSGENQGWRGSFRSWLCACYTSRSLSPTTSSYNSAWFPLAQHWAWAPTSLP